MFLILKEPFLYLFKRLIIKPIILLTFLFFSSIQANSQDVLKTKYVSLDSKLMNLRGMLTTIKAQTGITFCMIDDSVSNISILFSKKMNRIRVDSLLNMFCPEAKIEYKYSNGKILLKKIKSTKKFDQPIAIKPNTVKTTPNPIGKKTVSEPKNVIYDTIVKTVIDTVYITNLDTFRMVIKDTIYIKVPGKTTKIIEYKKPENIKIGLYGSLHFPTYFTFEGNGTETDSMKKNYSQSLSFSYSAEFIYGFKNWTLGTGITYTAQKTALNYFTPVVSVIGIDQWTFFQKGIKKYQIIEEYIQVPSNKLVQIWDSVPVMVNDSTKTIKYDTVTNNVMAKSNNAIRFLEIPVYLTYNFRNTKKLKILTQFGIITGVIFNSTGKTFENNRTIKELGSHNTNYFSVKTSVGIGLEYRFYKNISLYGSANTIYNLTSVFNNSLNYTEKQIWTTVNFGFRFIVN